MSVAVGTTTKTATLWMLFLAALCAPAVRAQGLVVSANDLFFSFSPGGSVPPAQSLVVSAGEEDELDFTATVASGKWLTVAPTSDVTPATLRVSVNPASLAPGTYSDLITIRAGDSAVTVSVALFVASRKYSLIASPAILSFTADTDNDARQTRIVNITSGVSANTAFSIAPFGGGSWLTVQPTTGVTPLSIEVSVHPSEVISGIYSALVNIVDPDGQVAFTVQVTLTVTGTSPIELSPEDLFFSVPLGTTAPQSETVLVSSGTDQAVTFTASVSTTTGGNWLTATPLSGTTNTFVSVKVNPNDLEEGIYHGVVTFTGLGRTVELPVTLNVVSGPLLEVTPTDLSFTVASGSVPPLRTVTIESLTGDAIPFQVNTGAATWLVVSPRSGTTFAALGVTVNPQGLGPGIYLGKITITATGSSTTWTIDVQLTVTTQVQIGSSPSQISWVAQDGDTETFSQTLSLTSTQGNPAFTVSAVPDTWLSVDPVSGTLPAQIRVSADPSGLAENTYTGSIVVTVAGADNSPLAIPVSLKISPAEPVIGAILHGATLRPGIFAPGTSVSLFGRGLGPAEPAGLEIGADGKVTTELSGVRVFFDEIPAPLTYVQERQINAVVPFAVFGRTAVRVAVEYAGIRSDDVNLQIFDSAPGIFTMDSSGQGIGAIINDDGTFNSARFRARRGSIATVFATGGGQTRPPGEDAVIIHAAGSPPLLPVKAFIGGKEAEVSYAGGAPSLISGVLQVNIRVPADAPVGLPPLVIQVGDLRSQPAVNIAVE